MFSVFENSYSAFCLFRQFYILRKTKYRDRIAVCLNITVLSDRLYRYFT